MKIRRDSEIHDVEGGWFRARWHFSFDDYVDPENDSFGAMRVFNDDRLIAGAIWPMHPHRDVEGLTYVVEGTFGHQDDVGGAYGPLPAGSVQRMTLGSGRAALGAERIEGRADAVHPDLDPAGGGPEAGGGAARVHDRRPHGPAAERYRPGETAATS